MHLNRYLSTFTVAILVYMVTADVALAVEETGEAASQDQSLGVGVLLIGVIAVITIAAVLMGRMSSDES